jgi:hypothetical protein
VRVKLRQQHHSPVVRYSTMLKLKVLALLVERMVLPSYVVVEVLNISDQKAQNLMHELTLDGAASWDTMLRNTLNYNHDFTRG